MLREYWSFFLFPHPYVECLRNRKWEKPVEQLKCILEEEMEKKFFSGYQIASFQNGKQLKNIASGTTSFHSGTTVSEETFFDLASLTKALFTVPLFYKLFSSRKLSPDLSLRAFFPNLEDTSLLSLLSHSSGYPAYVPFFESAATGTVEDRKKQVLNIISRTPRDNPPTYSDINYILLGFILEKISGVNLESLWKFFLREETISTRLRFSATPLRKDICCATMFSTVRNRLVHGEVEDENCFYLGSACGHAGLFGSAVDVAGYLFRLLDVGWFQDQVKRLAGSGFDRPEGTTSSYGTNPNPALLCHLGFTGTAFTADPNGNTVSVFLTNRTHSNPTKPEWKKRIRLLRQSVFDTLEKRRLKK